MKYMIQTANISQNKPMTSYNAITPLSTVSMGHSEITINLDIVIFEDIKDYSFESIETLLSNSPKWATEEMVTKALKAMYPERFL